MFRNVLCLAGLIALLSATASAQVSLVDAFSAIPGGVFHDIVHPSPCGGHFHAPIVIDAGGGHMVTVSYYSEISVGGTYNIGCFNYTPSTWDTYRVANDPAVDPGDWLGEWQTPSTTYGDLILNFSEPLTGFGTTSLLGPFATSSRPNDADRFIVYDGPNATGNVLADVTTDNLVHLQLRLDFKGVHMPAAEIRSVRYINIFPSFTIDGFAIAAEPQTSGVDPATARPVVLSLGAPFPSPFTAATRLALEVSDPGPVRVDVYQVSGRRVATLLDGVAFAGSHALTWNGRDAHGMELPAGLYLIRARTATEAVTQRVIRVR